MVIAVLAYWAVGLLASYVFGFMLDMGGIGVWMGLVLGLACAGVPLTARFWLVVLARVGRGGVS